MHTKERTDTKVVWILLLCLSFGRCVIVERARLPPCSDTVDIGVWLDGPLFETT